MLICRFNSKNFVKIETYVWNTFIIILTKFLKLFMANSSIMKIKEINKKKSKSKLISNIPLGVRLLIYSHFKPNFIFNQIALLSKKERKILTESNILAQGNCWNLAIIFPLDTKLNLKYFNIDYLIKFCHKLQI